MRVISGCKRAGLLLVIVCSLQGQLRAGAEIWSHDFDQAEAEAKRRGVPLLVHFHASWCMPCRKMDRDVLNDPGLANQLRNGFVAVKVDSDQRKDLVHRFEIETLPSDVFLDPQGYLLDRATGTHDRQTYLSLVARVEARNRLLRNSHIASQTKPIVTDSTSPDQLAPLPIAPSPIVARTRVTAPLPTSISPQGPRVQVSVKSPARRKSMMVGLRGFSPVSLITTRRWVRGDNRFGWYYKGVAYFMASPGELERFKASPDRFAPQVLGCDPVILDMTDRAVPGDIQFAAFFEGELYLFVSEKSRQAFKQDPERYVHTKHVLKIDEADDTRTE